MPISIADHDAASLDAIIERNRDGNWPDVEDKRKAFAYEYVIDYNHRRAAEEVGFKADQGVRLKREPLLAAFISELVSRVATSNFITADFIQTQYLNLLPMMMGQEEVAIVDKDGNSFEAKIFNGPGSAAVLRDMSRFVIPVTEEDPYSTAQKIQAAINAMNNVTEGTEGTDDADQ